MTLIVLAGLWNTLHAQKIVPPLPTDVLARVGSTVITGRDLIERIELMPWPEKEKPTTHDSSKVKALNSLVAERLLSLQGRMQNTGGDEGARRKVKAIEKLFVRDELYKREVKQKIAVSESEINDGLAKFAWQLHAAAVGLADEPSADSLYRLLQRGVSLPGALRKLPAASVASVETVQVNFGGLDTVFENSVYSILKKKFTKPFQCPTYGWTVAVLIDRGSNPVAEKMSAGDKRYRVEETIRNKKEGPFARRFIASVLVQEKATVDSVMFERLAAAMHAILSRDSAQHKNKNAFALTSDDVDELQAKLQSDRNSPLVAMKETPLLLGDAIEEYRFLHLGFQSLEMKKFKGTLNANLRFVVETELLAREGYKRNLQYSENVKHDVDLWSNYWTSRYQMWNVEDTVRATEPEVLSALNTSAATMGGAYEVNIQEVLCDNLATVGRVLDEASHGTPMADLARTYSIRPEWKSAGGVSGYMPLTKHPELTHRALMADSGAIVGPLRVENGFSVFRVIGKRRTGGADLPTVDSVVINIKDNLTAGKRNRTMSGYVAGLARQYKVDINYEKLRAITIQPANMYTRRNIGFGGIITAAPMLYPNWEWVKEYRDGGTIIP
ncbi:MAG TPA: hypothetical protein VK470_13130 [Bacteroidota bacterium]|nr:hypothetical protein [Bacteroidota bacterium]